MYRMSDSQVRMVGSLKKSSLKERVDERSRGGPAEHDERAKTDQDCEQRQQLPLLVVFEKTPQLAGQTDALSAAMMTPSRMMAAALSW
jgi:hypothetical protein